MARRFEDFDQWIRDGIAIEKGGHENPEATGGHENLQVRSPSYKLVSNSIICTCNYILHKPYSQVKSQLSYQRGAPVCNMPRRPVPISSTAVGTCFVSRYIWTFYIKYVIISVSVSRNKREMKYIDIYYMIYENTVNRFWVRNSSSWVMFDGAITTPAQPHTTWMSKSFGMLTLSKSKCIPKVLSHL